MGAGESIHTVALSWQSAVASSKIIWCVRRRHQRRPALPSGFVRCPITRPHPLVTLRQSNDPYGFKKLLVYQKAEELMDACTALTSHFPHSKTLSSLQDQMDRSARSVKQNIVEGWKRNGTREYYDFLGFSMGANAELEEDCDDIIKGRYEMGGKGIMGERGFDIARVEKLPFYPLNTHLPLLIQLKLRCKELNMLLQKLQKSLEGKMSDDHTLSHADQLIRTAKREDANDEWLRREMKKYKK